MAAAARRGVGEEDQARREKEEEEKEGGWERRLGEEVAAWGRMNPAAFLRQVAVGFTVCGKIEYEMSLMDE